MEILNGLHLADPDFGQPRRIDIHLGVEVYAEIMLQGQRSGPPSMPAALKQSLDGYSLEKQMSLLFLQLLHLTM